ncbi:glycosyltransferase family 28 domain-containing protein [Hypomontagnella submonticulosa]|nr:glycosyltransferase family 28 domain-containing protein [Hypomontagnella submonticulosa]
MPFNKLKSEAPGNLTIGHGITQTTSRVNSDGRMSVQFHRNPRELAAWFNRFHDNFIAHPERKVYAPRKGSSASRDEKATGATGPRLNIAIHIVGSRGDVQPFIPIAQLLSRPPFCHRVRICTHPVFKDFVESKGLEFFSIGGDPEALMAYMVKNPGLLPSKESFKAGDIRKRRKEMGEIMHGAWRSCIEAGDGMGERIAASEAVSANELFIADAIIANPPSMAHIHCAEKLSIPLHMVFTMPWSPTHAFHHPLASMQYGQTDAGVANYLSFMMMELLTWQGLGDVINKFRTRTLKLDPISPLWGHQLLSRLRVPFTYLWSESLIPKPQDWGSHIRIAGFSFLSQAASYTPPPDLVEFLNSGPPPIYIGFGSIVVDDPKALTELIFEAVALSKVRAIMSKGWGGIGGGDVPENVYLIGDCPHDWLFQHVSCVIHHGGAGTTAAGLAAGCPTIVIPFFGDQPFWGQMIARAGAGPNPIPYKKLTAEVLAESIVFALRPEVQEAAKEVARKMAEEDGADSAARDIQERIDTERLRCDICPNELAIWKHKKTGAHLSTLAAVYLVNQGIIKIRHLKTLRHRRWYIDEGAESVAIGIIAAFSAFFTDVSIATSQYVRSLKSGPLPRSRRKSSALRPSRNSQDELRTSTNPNSDETSRDTPLEAVFTPKQLEKIARRMAEKPFKPAKGVPEHLCLDQEIQDFESITRQATRERADQSRARHVARASGQYASELTRAGLKAPVAFFYNVANGLRNFPSYAFGTEEDMRRRDEITGLKSGVKVAGKEFALGFYDAFGGLVLRPYRGAKRGGAKGLGKGLLGAAYGFGGGIGSGVFGLPGYTLKGIEKKLSKHRLTELKAEILLIRFRQGMEDFRHVSDEDKREIIERWKTLHGAQQED